MDKIKIILKSHFDEDTSISHGVLFLPVANIPRVGDSVCTEDMGSRAVTHILWDFSVRENSLKEVTVWLQSKG